MGDEHKFSVPEPPAGMVPGSLSEFWQSKEPLPTISGWEVAWYYLQRGFQTITALPGSNAITILTIAVSLFLFSGFLVFIQNVDKIIKDAGSALNVTVYLKEGAADEAITPLVEQLRQNRNLVRGVNYIPKDQALELFRQDLGSRSAFLAGLEEDNPLPASIQLELQPDVLGIRNTNQVLDGLQSNTIVDEVVYGSSWVEKTQGVLRVFRFFGFIVLVVVLGIIIFLIANTIKLVIYSRRDEISIMQLVGATPAFVRMPFVIGGALQGLVGSIFALAATSIAFYLVNAEIRGSAIFGVALPQLMFFGLGSFVGVVVLGTIVGAVGSLFALGRYMEL